ncbi:unnamed protein product, partial [Rotaria sp. Silwood2]
MEYFEGNVEYKTPLRTDNVPQQVVSPTFISIIPPSNTTQPNSYLSTVSSISISTD